MPKLLPKKHISDYFQKIATTFVKGILLNIFLCLLSFSTPHTTEARLVFTNDLYDATDYIFTIDGGGSASSDITLKFGSTANESLKWDITSNKFLLSNTLDITGGLLASGQVNFASAAGTRLREVASTATAACATVNEVVINTTDKKLYTCTVTGNPGTWTASSGAQDFESVYGTDTGKNLVTTNDIFTINTGTNDFVVDSNDWNITAAGALDAATITSNGLLTGLAGTTISGGVINLNASSNFAVNIATGTSTGTVTIGGTGTQTISIGSGAGVKTVNLGSTTGTSATTINSGTGGLLLTGGGTSGVSINTNNGSVVTNLGTGSTTGQVSIGGGSNCVQVDSNTWDISCAGVLSGMTGITSTGTINFSGASSFRIPEAASDPGTCTAGQQYYNTTTSTVRLCVATNTWSSVGAAGTQYVFAYDTTTQTVAVANTFQDITFDTNGQIDGWTHTAGTGTFTATAPGTYMVNMTGRVAKNGGANTSVSIRAVLNGVEIAGSQSYGTAAGSSGDTLSGNFIVTVTTSDVLKIQLTGGTNNVRILPGGTGTAKPSAQLSIWRMK